MKFINFRRKSIELGPQEEIDDNMKFENGKPPKGCWYYFSKCIGGTVKSVFFTV